MTPRRSTSTLSPTRAVTEDNSLYRVLAEPVLSDIHAGETKLTKKQETVDEEPHDHIDG